MASLDACTQLCTDLTSTIGPTVVQTIGMIAGLVLVWYRGKMQTKAVSVEATKAKVEARAAQVQLAEIKGSLRPVTVVGTGQSGLYEPVVFPEPPRLPVSDSKGKP